MKKKIKQFFLALIAIWFCLGFFALLFDDSVVNLGSAFFDNKNFYKSLIIEGANWWNKHVVFI